VSGLVWYEDPATLPFVRRVARFRNQHEQWSWTWREVARNDACSFIVIDHDRPHRWPWGLPTEAVDPQTITDESFGAKTARCLGGEFPPVPERIEARRKAYLRKHPQFARWVERHRALQAAR
jgi:hypothetical protein